MDFPIGDLLDEQACYDWLVGRLYPRGLACPSCGRKRGLGVHRRHRAPVLDYRCRGLVTRRFDSENHPGNWQRATCNL